MGVPIPMSGRGKNSLEPDEALVGLANLWFRLVLVGFVSFLGGVAVLVQTMVRSGMAQGPAYACLGLVVVASLLAIAWLNGVRSRAPGRIQGFLLRLGLYRPRGEEER
jgi:hypothetical protein